MLKKRGLLHRSPFFVPYASDRSIWLYAMINESEYAPDAQEVRPYAFNPKTAG